jgi:amino acid transporter
MPTEEGKDVEKVAYDSSGHDVSPGQIVEDHGAESELHRRLSTRHITMIALGSSIGMGLWLGSGTSLIDGGPAAMFIGCK